MGSFFGYVCKSNYLRTPREKFLFNQMDFIYLFAANEII